MFKLSVVIPTYNPKPAILQQTLDGLRRQLLPTTQWECILVDNASDSDVLDSVDANWHPNLRVVREDRQGLTFARLRGFDEMRSDLMVLVDDDNILDPDYLVRCLAVFEEYAGLGVAGGRSRGVFETPPASWMEPFLALIAVRPVEHPAVITKDLSDGYPIISPIGAGMAVSRACFRSYYDHIASGQAIVKDRTGKDLSSGGDNEIIIIALKEGFQVGYFPELALTHLISKERIQADYLKRLNFASSRSWVKLLHKHGICPWRPIPPTTLGLRKIKAFFTYRAWAGQENMIRYYGACGHFTGLSELGTE